MKADHVIMLTRELEPMVRQFERLGFTLSPVGEHGPVFGTANRCVTFSDHYLEIVGIRADTPANAPMRAFMQHSAAVSMISLLSEDIDATHQDLLRRGLSVQPPYHIARSMPSPTGEASPLEFSVLTPMLPVELPPFFTMRKATAALFAEQWRAHPNTATRIISADVEVHDVDAAAAGFEQVGCTVTKDGPRRIVVSDRPTVTLSPMGSLPVGGHAAPSERRSLLTIAVANLDAARRALSEQETIFREADGAIVADVAIGRPCAVRFVME